MRRLISQACLGRFLRAQEGATAIEYALIAAGVAGAIIAAVNTLGDSVLAMFTSVANLFN
jgi:pilus assembly protein Flp/PilA